MLGIIRKLGGFRWMGAMGSSLKPIHTGRLLVPLAPAMSGHPGPDCFGAVGGMLLCKCVGLAVSE